MSNMTAEQTEIGGHKGKIVHSQAFWQIYFPLIFSLLIFLISFYFLLLNINQGMLVLRMLSDIALIVIILPLFLSLFFALIILAILIYFSVRANEPIHNFFTKISHISLIALRTCISIAKMWQRLFIEAETWSSIFKKRPD